MCKDRTFKSMFFYSDYLSSQTSIHLKKKTLSQTSWSLPSFLLRLRLQSQRFSTLLQNFGSVFVLNFSTSRKTINSEFSPFLLTLFLPRGCFSHGVFSRVSCVLGDAFFPIPIFLGHMLCLLLIYLAGCSCSLGTNLTAAVSYSCPLPPGHPSCLDV